MLAVEWRREILIPGLELEWRGPHPITQEWIVRQGLTSLLDVPSKVAIISGPRGQKGDKGEPGVTQIIIEGGSAPTLLDGGNF